MCRSIANITISTIVFGMMLAFSIVLLALEDNSGDGILVTCTNIASTGTGLDLCVPCQELPDVTPTTNVLVYYDTYVLPTSTAAAQPPPAFDSDWNWFGYRVCNISSLGSMQVNQTLLAEDPQLLAQLRNQSVNISVSSDATVTPGACCCLSATSDSELGSNQNGAVDTTLLFLNSVFSLECPRVAFKATLPMWVYFIVLVFSAIGVATTASMYVFVLCGCIEPTKGTLEVLAEGVQRQL